MPTSVYMRASDFRAKAWKGGCISGRGMAWSGVEWRGSAEQGKDGGQGAVRVEAAGEAAGEAGPRRGGHVAI